MSRQFIRAAGFLLLVLAAPNPAQAYIGPGAGLGAIAVSISLLLGAVLLFAGFIWYPLKRIFKRRRVRATPPESDTP